MLLLLLLLVLLLLLRRLLSCSEVRLQQSCGAHGRPGLVGRGEELGSVPKAVPEADGVEGRNILSHTLQSRGLFPSGLVFYRDRGYKTR